jgi:hypothetical protein
MTAHVRAVAGTAARAAGRQRRIEAVHRFETATGGAAW